VEYLKQKEREAYLAKFRAQLPENKTGNSRIRVNQVLQKTVMITTIFFSFVYYFFMKRSREKKVIAARQKMIRSTFAVYLNNYDDIEFNEKVRKVQDADRMQLNINNENDLAMFGVGYKRGNAASPSGGTNFFSE